MAYLCSHSTDDNNNTLLWWHDNIWKLAFIPINGFVDSDNFTQHQYHKICSHHAFVQFQSISGKSSLSVPDWKWLFYDVFTISEAYRWDASFKSSLLIILNEIAPRGSTNTLHMLCVINLSTIRLDWISIYFRLFIPKSSQFFARKRRSKQFATSIMRILGGEMQ